MHCRSGGPGLHPKLYYCTQVCSRIATLEFTAKMFMNRKWNTLGLLTLSLDLNINTKTSANIALYGKCRVFCISVFSKASIYYSKYVQSIHFHSVKVFFGIGMTIINR